jgi:hypothetical protein
MALKALDGLETPVIAGEVAKWGADGGRRAAAINYDVPVPGTMSWQRIVPLGLDGAVFVEGSKELGVKLSDTGIWSDDGNGKLTIADAGRLKLLYQMLAPGTARPSLRAAAVNQDVAGAVGALPIALPIFNPRAQGPGNPVPPRAGGPTVADTVASEGIRRASFLKELADQEKKVLDLGLKTVTIPTRGIGNSIRPIQFDPAQASTSRIALVETWELRSFLGDYGLGKTLQTFSLLPGERTMITIETWRSDESTREDASSVFDSSDTAAQERFTSTLSQQSGVADQSQGGWALSVNAKYMVGVNFLVTADMGIEAGFAANHQEAHQEFSTSVADSASEHAAQVNTARRQTVESSSSTTTASGSSTTTSREIANTNLRRVLNFVFRELNQAYETLTVLRDVKVAFYNGNLGSADIVPISDLRRLLARHIKPEERAKVAKRILAAVAQTIDETGTPVTTLEVGTRPAGTDYDWQDAHLKADGELDFNGDPLDTDHRWRFKPGPLGQRATAGGVQANDKVNGVVIKTRDIVLRTDQVVVEALLGQADALDPYASALQAIDLLSRAADLDWREAESGKLREAIEVFKKAGDKVDAYERMLAERPPQLDLELNKKP